MSALSPRGSSGADDVLKIFDALLEAKIEPNTITYVSVIRAWGDKGDWRKAEQVWMLRSICRCRPSSGQQDSRLVHCFPPSDEERPSALYLGSRYK